MQEEAKKEAFVEVKLSEYEFAFVCAHDISHNRRVVIIAEGEAEAVQQATEFAKHLDSLLPGEHKYAISAPIKLENFHVTYTDVAWEKLCESIGYSKASE